ncbi:hypothetical protein [Actinomadura chokoriensis]|uniref:Uncharacterized protein n=1 Tax=Actinomadura chokoriensis TaxID=454156 RepID=A0ABV4RAT3_9ACTN
MEFELDGRRVSLAARRPASSDFRVLVDGDPIPMEVTRIERHTGNLGTHTRELEAQHPAPWVRIEGTPWEPDIRGPRTAYIFFELPAGYVYNTSVWRSQSVGLTFTDDFSSVAVICIESVDTST